MEEYCRDISPLFMAQNPFNVETLLSKAHEQGFVFLNGGGGLPFSAESRRCFGTSPGKPCDSCPVGLRDGNFRGGAPCVAFIGFGSPDKVEGIDRR
jgi:hypothetical protein